MITKKLPNTHLRLAVAHGFLTVLDIYLLTVIDTLIFLFYAFQRNIDKQQKIVETKRAHRVKRGTGENAFFRELLKNIRKELDWHHTTIPFIVRIIPTIVVAAIIWLL